MDQNSVELQAERILELLKEKHVSTIVLSGKSGSGKTWMARKVGLLAVKKKVVDITLWISLSIRHDETSLYEHIAHQLSLLSTSVELENYDIQEVENNVGKEETLESLKEKVRARLSTDNVLLGVLVILDDEGNQMREGDGGLEQVLHSIQQNSQNHSTTAADGDGQQKLKVLITSRNEDGRHQTQGGKEVVEMMPLTPEMSIMLLKQGAVAKVFEIPGVESVVAKFINRKTDLAPGEVSLLAKLLSYHQQVSELQGQEHTLEEAWYGDNYNCTQLLLSGYENVSDGVLVDFSGQGSHFFRDNGSVHYSELISYWILEGYLGPVNSLEEAYKEGHRILMHLMDCQMLKEVNDDFVHMVRVTGDVSYRHRRGYGGTANLGLANVLVKSNDWQGIGKLTKVDGMIRTLGSYKRVQQSLTLLLDGNCLSRENPNNLLLSNQELQILGLCSLEIVSLPHSFNNFKKLNVLVLRDCDFLEKIDDIRELMTLTVLEVSGSGLVKKLSWLILKRFSHLTKLQSLKECQNLMVIDLSGAASLPTFPEKNVKSLPKLQTLNLSNSKIKSLPIFHETGELTHLSVSGCSNMDRVPSIRSLTNLQVLDLSWSTIVEFQDKSFQNNTSLKVLDLSGTAIPSLPFNIGKFSEYLENLRVLNLSGTKVKDLPSLSALHNLHQLLLSCCLNLEKLPRADFIEHKSKLQVLNLSETLLEELPALANLKSLKHLFLRGCGQLEVLPLLEELHNLEILDLSQTALRQLPFIGSLSNLHKLFDRHVVRAGTLSDNSDRALSRRHDAGTS
ncbi:putative disease resistance protein At4g19050 [Coffea eugenioides]|uniref:putative disease resistance protein At4g19050 n=1 Tax=Coffea eugenioides TaxID=49369 RepID=UPI000F60D194|nr:putative disease resistance protein At4g19050 [Coffea eugenioides]